MSVEGLRAAGPEVQINHPDWKDVLGSNNLPVKSFTAQTIRGADGRTVEVYLVDLARLTALQRGALMIAYALADRQWPEVETSGVPIPCADCTPVQ